MPRRLVHLLQHALDRLLPPGCAACEDPALPGHAFCQICDDDTYLIGRKACPRCALPLPLSRSPYVGAPSETPSNEGCQGCKSRPHSPIERTTALWEYEGAVAEALRRIKYSGDLVALQTLVTASASMLAPALSELPTALFVPVPAHPENLRNRGFHLPSLLARRWAQNTHHRAALFGLRKIRRTSAQASLGLLERRTNLRDAFEAQNAHLPGSTIMLIDDVLTTGATLDAAAEALRQAGVKKIHALVLARSLPRQ